MKKEIFCKNCQCPEYDHKINEITLLKECMNCSCTEWRPAE